jgi:uncharacterized protein YfaT (DUF1175 family)
MWREAPPHAAPGTGPELTDLAGDGTPDFLRLEDPADRQAFTAWFTFLAEAQHYLAPQDRPRELNDCAALVRFAFREALRKHDASWAGGLNLPVMPSLPPVRKYWHPATPLGPRLFRVAPGPFTSADLSSQAFAEFADAETLLRYNCCLLTRNWRRAAPGDLLFYRQVEQDLPFHVMIYLGPGHFERGGPWVIYHTGPLDGAPGEIRRPAMEELMRHPSPRWHPRQGNLNFLGVYRWNIVRDTG